MLSISCLLVTQFSFASATPARLLDPFGNPLSPPSTSSTSHDFVMVPRNEYNYMIGNITKLTNDLNSQRERADKCWQSIYEYIRALLDIFVTRHYPYWLGPPPSDKVEKWQNLFLNFADEFVRAIKVILQTNGMSEDLFLEVNILGTYKSVGIEVHPTHLTAEQVAIIKEGMTGWAEYLKDIIDIMLHSLEEKTLSEAMKNKYEITLSTLLCNQNLRFSNFINAHIMLKIVQVNVNYCDEAKLSQEFEKKPVGTWYDKKGDAAYLLFPNFEVAHAAWDVAKNKAEFILKNFLDSRSNLLLIDPRSLEQYSKVRTIKVVGAIDTEKYKKEFISEKEEPTVTTHRNVVLYTYNNFLNALAVYERNKKNNIQSISGKEVVLELISKY